MSIRENVRSIRKRIEAAAERADRDPSDILFVAVTKTRPVEAVEEVLEAGVGDIGENRVQELLQKYDAIGSRATWHLVGSLQRNKVNKVVGLVSLIHSIDSSKLARAVGARAVEIGIEQDVLLEVNVSGEETKKGFTPESLMREAPAIWSIDGLAVKGLMTMAPFVDDPEEARPVFAALARLRRRLAEMDFDVHHLSMGMTNDFEVAIEEGATIIRVGTAVFA